VFCVECGAEGREMIGSLCRPCYEEKHVWAKMPAHVDVTLCAHCSSALLGDTWKDVQSVQEAIEGALELAIVLPEGGAISDLTFELDEKDPRNMNVRARVSFILKGMAFEREVATLARIKRGSCKECSKKMGSYYEAILQVRGPERRMSEADEEQIEQLVRSRVGSMREHSREVFVSKVERVKGGLDFYLSTSPSARAIARELQESRCAEYKESSSLWGRRGGEELSRMTFLIRLPCFSNGDVVEYQGRDYYVRNMSRNMVHTVDVASGEPKSLKLKGADEFALACPRAKILQAIVLTESDSEIQVLNPEGMTPLDLKKPANFERKGEHIRLVKTRLGTYPLSDSW